MANRDVDRIAGSSRSTRYRRRKMYKEMFPKWETCSQTVQADAHFELKSIASNSAPIKVIYENQPDEVHDLLNHENIPQFIGLLNVSQTEMINRVEPVIYHSVETDSLETLDHTPTNVQPDVTKIFRKVAISANMSHKQISIMLRHVRQIHPELPKDARTLLKTFRHCVKKYIAGGQYVHFGLSETILAALRRCPTEEHEELRLQLHVDGMSVFKSSRLQLWPILGRIINPKTEVFIIGLFCGYSKPKDVHEYFGPLIPDLRSMQETGLNIPHMGVSVPLILDCIIGDAPARAYMKQVKSHAGYYSCEQCTSRGKYLKGKMTFSAVPHTLRTDHADRKNITSVIPPSKICRLI